ncbi:hypothetical protein BGZ65_005643 [Modicella reniformis]|uniref:Uncharacterized protein n=1 Tax=Modicella reniformis TaxID=1440133 RepID=A0A9P6JHR6_9FUNG|nr:hypothetical protein BGZ65_005643 [Modicella reniformis]
MTKTARERGDYYPKQIYYCASEEEAAQFHSKYLITNVSNLSAENRFVVETSGAAASSIQDTQHTINDTILALGKDMVERSRKQDEELAGLKREMAELKKLIKSLSPPFSTNNVPS